MKIRNPHQLREWHLQEAARLEQEALAFEAEAEAKLLASDLAVAMQGRIAERCAKIARENCRKHIAAATDLTDYSDREIESFWPILPPSSLPDHLPSRQSSEMLINHTSQRWSRRAA